MRPPRALSTPTGHICPTWATTAALSLLGCEMAFLHPLRALGHLTWASLRSTHLLRGPSAPEVLPAAGGRPCTPSLASLAEGLWGREQSGLSI